MFTRCGKPAAISSGTCGNLSCRSCYPSTINPAWDDDRHKALTTILHVICAKCEHDHCDEIVAALATLTRENAELREKVVWQGECLRQQDDKETTLTRERDEARAEVSKLRAYQTIPLIDQNGHEVGVENISFNDLHRHEVHMDADGVVWTRPTAWAWMMRCKTADATDDELRTIRAQLTATQARLDEAVGLLADALTGARDWQRRRFSFLAQQEGQSNG